MQEKEKNSRAKGQTVCDERRINGTKTPEGDEPSEQQRDAEERSDNIVLFRLLLLYIPGGWMSLSETME